MKKLLIIPTLLIPLSCFNLLEKSLDRMEKKLDKIEKVKVFLVYLMR